MPALVAPEAGSGGEQGQKGVSDPQGTRPEGDGQTAQRDFSLADAGLKPAAAKDQIVEMSAFVVSTSKEMDGAAIAINEQRFAANIVNVVAADEFGHVAEGNVGEFLKAGKVPGTDFLCFRVPGSQGMVAFNSDQFAMFAQVDPAAQAAQGEMARAIMSPSFQSAFNVVKGSVPGPNGGVVIVRNAVKGK